MKLEQLIAKLDELDPDLTMFQRDHLDVESEIILLNDDVDEMEIEKDGVKYFYLIEVFIAQDFVESWLENADGKPNNRQIAERLFEYAINDD